MSARTDGSADGDTRVRSAAQWADAVSERLLTYSRMPADVITFARTHGVIAGVWLATVHYATPDHPALLVAENGWSLVFDGDRFVALDDASGGAS